MGVRGTLDPVVATPFGDGVRRGAGQVVEGAAVKWGGGLSRALGVPIPCTTPPPSVSASEPECSDPSPLPRSAYLAGGTLVQGRLGVWGAFAGWCRSTPIYGGGGWNESLMKKINVLLQSMVSVSLTNFNIFL